MTLSSTAAQVLMNLIIGLLSSCYTEVVRTYFNRIEVKPDFNTKIWIRKNYRRIMITSSILSFRACFVLKSGFASMRLI